MKYEINHQPFTILTVHMEEGETVKCQSGAMAWMSPDINMETKTDGIGGMLKKKVSGESLALNFYTAEKAGELALAKHSPGDILAFNLAETPVIAQKSAFLASTVGVEMDLFLQHKIATGFFGGEGFVMQKFSGQGYAWFEIDGAVQEKELAADEKLIVDSGYVAVMESTCTMDIQAVKGLSNIMLGGEGLFNTVITGPGKVWLQTMPASSLAMSLAQYMPHQK